jgi:putative DNA primase/helicase
MRRLEPGSQIGADPFTFERKFRDPVHAVPTAKLMIATNALPRFNDKTLGIWRRILLVPFDKTFDEEQQDKNLAQEITNKELPGIFNWALDGLRSLNKSHGFVSPARNDRLLEEYRCDSDPTRAFLVEHFTASPNAQEGRLACSEVYKRYQEWCQGNGCHPLGERAFGQQVRRVFPGVERRRLGSRGGGSMCTVAWCPMDPMGLVLSV